MRGSAKLLLGLLALGGAFAWGFVSAKRRLPPHDLLVGLWRGEAQATPESGAIETRMPTGWFVEGEAPPDVGAILGDLEKLGYAPTYQAPAERFGVVLHDPARAQDGVNLVVSAHRPDARLVDMEGRTLHAWSFAYEDVVEPQGFTPRGTFGTRFWRRARVLPDGDLLAIYDNAGLIRLDRDSNLRWSLSGGYHHDLDVLADGTIWVLSSERHVLSRIHASEPVIEDLLVQLDGEGRELRRFSLLEAFERSAWAPLLTHAKESGDLFHTNSLEVFDGEAVDSPLWGEGRALVSIWGLDTVAVVDLDAERVEWAATGLWHRQHEPQFLANGELLVFDNLGPGERSRVLQVEPLTQRVTWSYGEADDQRFFSTLIGTAQRLANGNTLVTESLAGNAFEVTPEGETVWRFQSPFRAGENDEGVAVLMEVVRLPREEVGSWLPGEH